MKKINKFQGRNTGTGTDGRCHEMPAPPSCLVVVSLSFVRILIVLSALEMSFSGVGNVYDVPRVSVHVVGDLLSSGIGQEHVVMPLHFVLALLLAVSEVEVFIAVLHVPGEFVASAVLEIVMFHLRRGEGQLTCQDGLGSSARGQVSGDLRPLQ